MVSRVLVLGSTTSSVHEPWKKGAKNEQILFFKELDLGVREGAAVALHIRVLTYGGYHITKGIGK